MSTVTNERRSSSRRNLGIRVQLFRNGKGISQPAHLHDINETGIYLITRVRLAVNERIEIEVPSRRRKDVIRMTVKVIRPGRHRCWGLFSYGCRLLESHGR